ncbi:PorP/SprF family type IX secretion system membrane protein [Fulvivirga sp. 29W222]|uniref:PorP/SprF family type IX secretion system membrane protein n=1 Tax=Fulvivirga marina TaxID=2494733 RepID=A0A937G297_9BACT|nr:PorP/SprF family type IX secretion system membrane protein [Fulvivirga marina]MBL6448896.1 PorP/SprF family type IX secretion system membrane protein [Fulvivirga marina]
MRKITSLIALLILVTMNAFGQQVPSYNQFFFNPALYNPSFIGQSGYTEANINHRQQWVGIEGAPVTTNVNIQTPLSERLAFGLVLYSDKLGLITTYETTAGFSYNINLGPTSRLSFGLTAGVGRNEIEFVNNDPAYANALDRSFYFSGQFGVNFTLNRLTVGFALPQLMESQFAQEKNFEEIGLEATKLTFSSVSYKFDLGQKLTLEPTIFYQSDEKSIDQLGGLAAITYNDLFWVGGGYREEQGANGFAGFTINEFIKVGYAYEFAPAAISSELGDGTHEFQVSIKLGKNKRQKNKTIVSNEVIPTRKTDNIGKRSEVIDKEEAEETAGIQPITKEGLIHTDEANKAINNKEVAPEEKEEDVPVIQKKYVTELEERLYDEDEAAKKEKVIKPGELAPGFYVIVGTYQSKQNAESYAAQVRASGYYVSVGFNPATSLNYVYIKHSEDFDSASEVRNQIRKIYEFEFQEAWILNIK